MPAGPSFTIDVKWDAAGMRRVDKTLGNFQGRNLQKAVDKALGRALKPMSAAIRSAEGTSGIVNRSGKHYRSIKVRKPRRRPGEMAAWTVGPSDYKRFWLVRGHRIVAPGHGRLGQGGVDSGRRAPAFDYVGPVVERMAPEAVRYLESETFAQAVRMT